MKYNKLHKFYQLSLQEKLLFFEVLSTLVFAKMLIAFVPFKRIAPYLGHLNGDQTAVLPVEREKEAKLLRKYIFMVSNNVPWRSVCLDKALAAMMVLNRRKISSVLFLGVKRTDGSKKLDAHAWVICGDSIWVGGRESKQYTVTAWFSRIFT